MNHVCTGQCYVPLMVILWALVTIVLETYYLYANGAFSRSPNAPAPPLAPANFEAAAAGTKPIGKLQQRTFSYPDTLVSNYIDPDQVPEPLVPYSEIIFTTVQSIAQKHGFQVDNSRNQAEHLLLMLYNETSSADKLVSGPALRIHQKLFANYRKWCSRMGVNPFLMKDMSAVKSFELLIEDILMYLLIWGEAANLKHMPESLCFILHKIMQEHIERKYSGNGQLQGAPKYPGFFLDMVVTPMYEVVAEAMKKPSDHFDKMTYDDFNEFFWSPSCLMYSLYPMDEAALEDSGYGRERSFSAYTMAGDVLLVSEALKKASKTYLEKRSWLHPLYSMNRIFEWHVITFTLLLSWSFATLLQWTYAYSMHVASIVFIQINFMGILWTSLEVYTLFPNVKISDPSICGFLVRLLAGFLVLTYQCVYYHWSFVTGDDSRLNQLELFKLGDNTFWWWQYIWLSIVSCSVYFLESIICWYPNIVSSLMTWKNDVVQAFLNICYPLSQLYVGKDLPVPQKKVILYIIYWVTLISFKLWFGFRFIVGPVAFPTLELYDDYVNFKHISFTKTFTLVFFWWFPHFLVYLIDMSIWYAVWSSFVGGCIAIVDRQGAVRESEGFRSHFMRAPLAFCQKFIPINSELNTNDANIHVSTASFSNIMIDEKIAPPMETKKPKAFPKGGLSDHRSKSSAFLSDMSSQYQEMEELLDHRTTVPAPIIPKPAHTMSDFLDVRSQRWIVFARVWNEIIEKLRAGDLISNEEKKNFLFTYFDWLSKPVYLPLYQTAGCVALASTSFKDSSLRYQTEVDAQSKMLVVERFNNTFAVAAKEAVTEAWELTAWILKKLLGTSHLKDVDRLVLVISNWGNGGDLFARIQGNQMDKIVTSVASIMNALKGAVAKRKDKPLVTTDYLQQQKKSQDHKQKRLADEPPPDIGDRKGIKKSVSTGFLASLNDHGSENNESYIGGITVKGPPKPTAKFVKLQPFRPTEDLVDNARDKVREELRHLLGFVRTSLKIKGVTAEGQDLIDRITFILSLESGFMWSDIYASAQIDDLALDSNVPRVLAKLLGLLQLRATQVELKSIEAKRRLNFFMNSLFMDLPVVPTTRYCKEFTTITPYYSEDILLTKQTLEEKNSDGVSTILYLQTLYKQEWENFLERRGIKDEEVIWSPKHLQELRMWASARAQTLFRTVEGMMHTEAAIKLFCELEDLSDVEVDLLGKLKFNYVVACQVYGKMKKSMDHKAADIEFLLSRFPNLRVAYIDEVRVNRAGDTNFYSVLIKHDPQSKGTGVQEVFRVKLPGNPVLGEGKPENQNHAIIFSRGRYIQAIDMNQDGYFEESLKMRNLLQEFDSGCTILGYREHIFTGSVSSVANYMALQELSFVTLGQRVLNQPLRIRQHYGHPDLFDKMFLMTEGGMSKASKGINLSEDVFAGFNCTIRGKNVQFKEYVQVGKGRDVGLQQTYKFEAKLSQGNAEQSLSRDLSRICGRLDFFRLMSFYYGGIGHYMANTMVMFTLVVVVYIMLALALYGEEGVNGRSIDPEGVLQMALAGMGLLQTFPLITALTVEKGFVQAMSEIGFMLLSGGPLYFIFHIQTKSFYFQQTLMAGGAKYRPTGRGFVTQHAPFDEQYRFFASSHVYLGFELTVALIIFGIYTTSKQYPGLTWSLWLTAASLLLSPFWFNPLSFEWNRLQDDYLGWIGWMSELGGSAEQCWEAWWREENSFYKQLSPSWKLFMLVQKCIVWVVIAWGIAGEKFFTSTKEQKRMLEMLGLFAIYFLGNWAIRKMERYWNYAVRRFTSLILTTVVVVMTVMLILLHPQYIRYITAMYYFISAVSFIPLLFGATSSVVYVYKLHDLIVGHSIFLLLSVLAFLQFGYLQTWLLYHNALSAGVEIGSILKYARKSQARAQTESDVISELRAQMAQQERMIKQLLVKNSNGATGEQGNVEMSEKTPLLGGSSDYGSLGLNYSSTPAEKAVSPRNRQHSSPPPKKTNGGIPGPSSTNNPGPKIVAPAPKRTTKGWEDLSDQPSQPVARTSLGDDFVFSQPTQFPSRG